MKNNTNKNTPTTAKQDALAFPSKHNNGLLTVNDAEFPLNKLAYTAAETAFLLSISKRSLHRLVRRKLISPNVALRTLTFSRESVFNYLHSTTV